MTRETVPGAPSAAETDVTIWQCDVSPAPAPTSGVLERFFGPHHEAFKRCHFPLRPAVAHGAPERLGGLFDVPALRSPGQLLRGAPLSKAVLSMHGQTIAFRLSDGETAERLWQSGVTVVVDHLQRFMPEASAWVKTLASELEVPDEVSGVNLYLSSRGEGLPVHMDNHETLIVQIRGSKTWSLGPRPTLEFPLESVMPSELANAQERTAQVAAATESLRFGQVVEMVPGSVIFLPRGYWHRTGEASDSVSLTFNFQLPTWAQFFANGLVRRLLSKRQWRAPMAPGEVSGTDGLQTLDRDFRREVDALLEEVMPALRAALGATSPE